MNAPAAAVDWTSPAGTAPDGAVRSDQNEAGMEALAGARGAEVLTRRLDGAMLALFADKWRLNAIARDNPKVMLEPLLAGKTV